MKNPSRATLALLAALGLSGCGDKPADGASTTAPSTTASSPSATQGAAGAPVAGTPTAQTPGGKSAADAADGK